jgi:hypothetical protein
VLTQGLATLFWIGFGGGGLFRIPLGAGAIAAGFLGFRALKENHVGAALRRSVLIVPLCWCKAP